MSVLITIIAGGMLALMMYLNGSLSQYSDPVWSSFVTHFVGTLGALFLVALVRSEKKEIQQKAPLWSYAGGILGALTVIIGNITYDSVLGISGSFVLVLLGQTIFSIFVDQFGWFGMARRKVLAVEYMQVFLIVVGSSILVIYAK